MKKILLAFLMPIFCLAYGLNFDFEDARNKGYSDKEILDYVAKNVNGYDVDALRSSGLNDREIIDFFIQRDSVSSQIIKLQKDITKSTPSGKNKVFPEDISSHLALGCMVLNGHIKQQEDGWSYIEKLRNFASSAYTIAYLNEANYFDIQSAKSVSIKSICQNWLDNLKTKEEIKKLYALSLVREINSIVRERKSLVLD